MNKREYPRVAFDSSISLRSGNTNFLGMLSNLSLNGMYIRTDKRIEIGNAVDLTFSDITNYGDAAIKINGNVVRNDDGGIALKLRKMDVDSFIKLRLLIHRKIARA